MRRSRHVQVVPAKTLDENSDIKFNLTIQIYLKLQNSIEKQKRDNKKSQKWTMNPWTMDGSGRTSNDMVCSKKMDDMPMYKTL
jgi:hypothetical protein